MKRTSFAARGGFWVLAQFVGLPLAALVALVIKGTFEPDWPAALARAGQLGGGALLVASGILLLLSVNRLGESFTPFPKPLDTATFASTGIYGIVRHPIYAAVCGATFGLMLRINSIFGLLCACAIFVFFDRKAAYEEQFLTQRYSDYGAYRKRVKKLIPFIY